VSIPEPVEGGYGLSLVQIFEMPPAVCVFHAQVMLTVAYRIAAAGSWFRFHLGSDLGTESFRGNLSASP